MSLPSPDPSPDPNPDPNLDPDPDIKSGPEMDLDSNLPDPYPEIKPEPEEDLDSMLVDPEVDSEPAPEITPFTRKRRNSELPDRPTLLPKRQHVVSAADGSPCLVNPASVVPFPSEAFVRFIEPYLRPKSFVLQLGCRDGKITFDIAAYLEPPGHIVAVNVPGQGITQAEGNASLLYDSSDASDASDSADSKESKFTFIHVPDLTHLPFGRDSFDVVFACDIMAHLPARNDHKYIIEVLSEMRRVTKPSGFMASRDTTAHHFFPTYDLDNLITTSLLKATGLKQWCGSDIPSFYKLIGFSPKGIRVNSATSTRGHVVGQR
ncbi:hypothetical protein GGR51DRAFT_5365 [Nemania sp. FL0031]|nr:hypothetical protein GGR51DRAFT_5365 [Nemania sp. FL0031]